VIDLVAWIIAVALAIVALGVLAWLARLVARLVAFEKRAYVGGLTVLAVTLPGTAGFVTSGLFLLHQKADVHWPINHNGAYSFLYGTAISVGVWLVGGLLFQRYGRVEGANPTEYARLRSYYDTLHTRWEAVADREHPAAKAARTALDGARTALRLDGQDVSTRGTTWASQSGYVVVRASLEAADRALLRFQEADRLAAVTAQLRSQIDGSRILESPTLLETLRKVAEELDAEPPSPPPDLGRAHARLAQVQATVDQFRDGRRYGLVSARSALYGPIVLGGILAYLLLGLALIGGANEEQIIAGIVFYVVGVLIGVFRHLAEASAADSQVEEDYGLDDARFFQRPLFSGVAAVGGVVVTTILVTLAPEVTAGAQRTGQQAQQAQTRVQTPTLEEIFDLEKNPLAIVYAAIFGLTPGLLAARLGVAAEKFKVDLRSTQPSEHRGGG
jgi:hypothetical protein